MKWFGPPWKAPVNVAMEETETPVGDLCVECHKPIEENDQGYIIPALLDMHGEWIDQPWHRICFLKSLGL